MLIVRRGTGQAAVVQGRRSPIGMTETLWHIDRMHQCMHAHAHA